MNFFNDENGATAIEYGMIIGFMAGLIMTAYAGALSGAASAFDVIVTTLSVV
tara:strand:- start:3497 stop:3652 length:156 start_codon:yes stop_codon:yes gene_type:complete